jgi:hypothetical protein
MCKLRPSILALLLILGLVHTTSSANAQSGSQGTVQVIVQDTSGAVIPGADLTLIKLDTNDTRTAKASKKGDYSFVNLQTGTYSLTITKEGFQTKIFDKVIVDAGQTDGLTAVLPVGSASETVRVTGETNAVLETTSNQIGQVIDLKQVEDLPLQGRDLTSFSRLVAGYTGTFNGLPSVDSGNNIDGTQGTPSRGKYGTTGAQQASVSPRVEAIEQMSIQTDQLDIASGFGQSTTQINYVTRRGGNKFHFRAYEDFRNSGLNATSEGIGIQNFVSLAAGGKGVRKPKLILNDFGASVGGFVIRDKLFFFGSFASSRQPNNVTATNNILKSAAQAGNFIYTGTDNQLHTVNVYQIAGSGGFQSTPNTAIAAQFTLINQNLGSAAISNTSDPNASALSFNVTAPIIRYFPAARLDYNFSQKLRTYLSVLATTTTQPSGYTTPPYPGSGFSNQNAGFFTRNYIGTLGVDYTFTPNLINQFKLGYLYAHNEYNYNAAKTYNTNSLVFYNFSNYFDSSNRMSGQNYPLPVGNFYPLFSLSDSMTLQKGSHTIQFGFSGYREQDHYYNPPVGFSNVNLGLDVLDPSSQAFTNNVGASVGTVPYATATGLAEAKQLYAVLTGRVSSIAGQYAYSNTAKDYIHAPGRYNLNELSQALAGFAEDSYRITPELTLNFGMRWDFTFDNHDLTGAYHNALPDSLYGPTAQGQLFQPGALNGNPNPVLSANAHAYSSWFKAPQPAFGFAYNPRVDSGVWHKILGGAGGDGTVIRAGFGLRNFTEPYQFYWDAASDQGAFFYQSFAAQAGTTGKPGTYTPGSVSLGSNGPVVTAGGAAFTNYAVSPANYQATAAQSQYTFVNGSPGVYGFNPRIKQPYTETWNLSIQRELGRSRVLEIRYNGNRSIHQWVQINTNEVNVFENGFLAEFKRAQANLIAGGGKTFTDVGRGNPTPIMDAAFGGAGNATFTNATFINYLNNGQVGSFANQLAGNGNSNPLYFCNLVGVKFTPCATNAGYTTAGAGYPINFFQANPYTGGRATGQMTDSGYSNYNGLQIELRQGNWKGLQINANYAWSHSLGISPASADYLANPSQIYTLRNLALSYGPSPFDVAQVLHISGTYDLPFGKGRTFMNHGNFMNRIVGGFNVGTILTYQGGTPFLLTGGFSTFNTGDGGVTLNGVTSQDLQKSVGVHRIPGQTTANLLSSKYVAATGGVANNAFISPNTTPGTIGQRIWLHGPHAFYDDIALTKAIPIKEGVNFRIQSEFLNAFNHPVYGNTNGSTTGSVQSTSFSRAGITNETAGFGRIIELRANIEF